MKIFNIQSDIIKIAVKNGWQVTITNSEDGFFFDFHRRTLGGLPFSFTAELSGGRVGTLVDEIISFVDALDPEHYAAEWLEASGSDSPSRYFQAIADMDDIRTRAWLLAFDLSAALNEADNLLDFPWFHWN